MSHIVMCSQNMPVPRDPRVWREARALAAAGHRVTVVCPRGEGFSARERIEGVDILRYRSPPEASGTLGLLIETVNALFWTALTVLRVRRRDPIDVLHAANPPDTFFLIALLLRSRGTKFVFDQHDASPELLRARNGGGGWQEWLLRRLERWSYRTSDLTITPNNQYRMLATGRGGVDPDRVITVRSGIDGDLPDPRATRADATPLVVGFAGVLGVHDGADILLRAAAEVLHRRPGAIVVEMIGDGPAVPALEVLADELGIGDSVRWRGWLSGTDFRSGLQGFDLAISPDPAVAFNRISTMAKLLDYGFAGLAVIASDTPSNRETAGEAAAYVRSGDVAHLADAIERFVDDPEARLALEASARRRAPMHRWEPGAVRLTGAYELLLGTGAGPTPEQVLVAPPVPVEH